VKLYDVYDPNCPSRTALRLIGDRWTALIVGVLAEQPRHFGELRRRVPTISQKMLTQTLRSLERDGLVKRSVYDIVPPRVEYSLTPLGQTLLEPLRAICRWAENYLPQVNAARAGARDQRSVSSGRRSVIKRTPGRPTQTES
jgi:DNA-binding HxlR family transcriptional regulator